MSTAGSIVQLLITPANAAPARAAVEYSSCLQEYSFPDVVRLWDTLLVDAAGRADCLLRVCIAMLVHVREELLAVRRQALCTILS